MWNVDRFATGEQSIASAGRLVVALVFGALALGCVEAQTAPAKPNADTSPAAANFSIESEMLTYRALQSNSEAVACDIAAYLNGATADFKNPPAGSVCDVKAGTTKASVVLLPVDSSEFADFQIWRADMATMDRLQNIAEALGCPTKHQPAASKGATPQGIPQIAAAESVLALMASEESTSAVTGTIHDQAFMDGVGRELQELSVPVLMPTALTPYALTPLDKLNSPLLASLVRTMTARGRLEDQDSKADTKSQTSGQTAGAATSQKSNQTIENTKTKRIEEAISEINAFLDSLTKSAAPAPKNPNPQTANPPGGSPAPQSPEETQNAAATPAPPSSSHLGAVLLADGLAVKLGVDPDTGTLSPDDAALFHILLVKALESGGSVTRYSNVFRTKITYSGGSVGTYALFTMDGDLECSGNVYEYGGNLTGKDFTSQLRSYNPDPAKQMVFLRHSCRPFAHPQ
jgi:hypothetical protein